MVLGPDFSPQRLSMGDSHQEGALLTGGGEEMWKLWVWPLSVHNSDSGLSTEVVETSSNP